MVARLHAVHADAVEASEADIEGCAVHVRRVGGGGPVDFFQSADILTGAEHRRDDDSMLSIAGFPEFLLKSLGDGL